jgi:hypothetical protein
VYEEAPSFRLGPRVVTRTGVNISRCRHILLSLALYFPGQLLLNMASTPLNPTINLARATSETQASACYPAPRPGSDSIAVMRAIDFRDARKEGKQGLIIGTIRLKTFLEKQFKVSSSLL